MSKYRKYSIRGIIAGAFLALLALVGGFVTNNKPLVAQSARDCDSNSIIYCGALTVDELLSKYNQNSTKDLPQIYSAFSINPNALKTQTALGQVHKDGTVWLNGVQIGSGAITAGRHYKAGSTAVAGVWARSPSVSFAASSIDAFIGFENGKPAWAILSACGNPVKWSRPNTTIDKKVSTPDLKSWVEDATYDNSSEIRYLITLANTGNAPDTNVSVIDYLPAYQTYVAGSTKINGVAIAINNLTKNGINIGTLNPGQKVQVSFRTKLQVPATKCGVTDMVNKARVDSDKTGPKEDTATTHTKITCVTVKCNALTGPATLAEGKSATFGAEAVAVNTTVKSYEFKLDGKTVQNTTSATYAYRNAVAGKHTLAVIVHFANGATAGGSGVCAKSFNVPPTPKTVKCDSLTGPTTITVGQKADFIAIPSDPTLVSGFSFTVNGKPESALGNKLTYTFAKAGTYTITGKVLPKAGVTDGGSTNCVKTVTAKDAPKPVYSCDLLTLTPKNAKIGDQITARVNYTAQNGATFKSATFNFGEGQPVVVTTPTNPSATHTYTTTGTKNITAKVDFTVNGAVVSDSGSCAGTVTITQDYNVFTSCDALTSNKPTLKVGESATLNAEVTAQGTTVTAYDFSVNGTSVQKGAASSYTFTPTAAGEYTIAVSATFANGDVRSGAACTTKVTAEEVVTPVYTCDLLTLSKTTIKDGDKVTATVKYTAKNGATFSKAVVNFGEANVTVTDGNNGTFSAEHTYATAKDFNVSATVTFMVNGEEVSASGNCAGKVSPTPIEKCPIPGKEQYPKDDKEHCNDVKPAVTLPDTGAGSVIGIFAAVAAAGALLHNYFVRRSMNS